MIVHNYDKLTKEFTYSSQANIDELESKVKGHEVYLIPANCTTLALLPAKEGFTTIFDEKANMWKYIEDFRGLIVYSKIDLSPITVDYIGPLKDEHLPELPKQKNKYQVWQNGKYEYPDLIELKTLIKQDLDWAYEEKLQTTHRLGKYYVQPSWATIYTNTLVAMQEDMKDDNTLDQMYRILLITDPKLGEFEHLQVTSIEEFMPYYSKVKDLYKRLTEEYHDKIIKLSQCNDPETIVTLILTY